MRTIFRVCNKKCAIKWVNDIIYNGKKVCGILAQGYSDKAVVGIGVNYRTDLNSLPDDVRTTASVLYGQEEEAPDERSFVNALLENVLDLCTKGDEIWLDEYKASSTILGKEVLILQAGSVVGEGVATEIDDSCALHVVFPDGRETVLSTGEVSVRSR